MGARRESFFELVKVTDHDCGNYRIGEIDGIDSFAIKKYIEQHGEFGYRELQDACHSIIAVARATLYDENSKFNPAQSQEKKL